MTLAKYFKLEERKTNFTTELIGGTTTFLAMAYIIFVNPNVLATTGMDKTALITVTCVATALATLLTGLVANAPIAMAPGMGLNAFFAYTLVLEQKVNWQTALGIVFLSGFFFLLLTLVGLRKKLVEAIPQSLISAMSVGIGLFITFIGLVNLGMIVRSEATLVSAGPLTPTVLIGLAGFLVMILSEIKKVKGSLILGILTATLLAAVWGKVALPTSPFSFQFRLSEVALKLDIVGAFKWSLMGSIFALMFTDLFDSIGTLVACSQQAQLTDSKGKIKDLNRLLSLNAIASMIGALFGTSTVTAYVESAAGIQEGGRTGLAAVVTALWFLLGILFIPLIAIVPNYATAPALILVGFLMAREVRQINFTNWEEGFPAFVIMVMIALSYSISTGLALGFFSFVLFKVVLGKFKEVKPVMWLIAGFSLLYFIL